MAHMRSMQERMRFLLCSVLFMAAWSTGTTIAQTPIEIPGYVYDGVFRIGGETPHLPRLLHDSLHMTFGYDYSGPQSWWDLVDSSRWPSDAAGRYHPWMNWRMLTQADSVGFTLMYSPDAIASLFKSFSLLSMEHYYDIRGDTIHLPEFDAKGPVSNVKWLDRRFVAAGTFPSSTGGDQLMAGGPRFTDQGFHPSERYYWTDVLGLPDSSRYFDVTVTMNAGDIPAGMQDTTILAYVRLYRRVTEVQDAICPTCLCPFYVQWGEVNITKGMYLNGDPADTLRDGTKFFDITATVDFLRDSVDGQPRYQAPISGARKWEEYQNVTSDTCQAVFTRLQNAGAFPPGTFMRTEGKGVVEAGDFYYDIYTTRKVPITFLRGRFGAHLLDYLARPARYDSSHRLVAYINNPIDSMARDPKLWPIIKNLSIMDETRISEYGAYRILSSMITRRIQSIHSTDTSKWHGIMANPIDYYSSLRVFSGDLDSTAFKPINLMIVHKFPLGGSIPQFYANSNRMDSLGFAQYFADIVAPSTAAGHRGYIDHTMASLTNKKLNVCDAIDVARFKFRHLGRPPFPVYNDVQTGGYIKYLENPKRIAPGWDYEKRRVITPEEITAQAWLTLNCGAQGMMFADVTSTGQHVGIMTEVEGRHDSDYMEYYSDFPGHSIDPALRTPKIWLGYNQRFAAVRRVTDAISRIDTLYSHLIFNQEQIAVEELAADTSTTPFARMPMIDSVYTVKPEPFTRPDSIGAYTARTGTDAVDSLARTFLEITHFTPGPLDSVVARAGGRYLLLTNKRTWPNDYDSVYAGGGSSLGAIDPRLPTVRLKNSTGVLADSFRIERVGGERAWSRTAAFGTNLALEWLEPGWGALYRVTPVSSGVSTLGVAYNNGVHVENPSGDSISRDRIMVYERDSVVYLRTLDSLGRMSGETMISSPADTILVSGVRIATNMFPSVATVRNGTACLVVWERHVNTGQSMVQVCRLNGLPTRTSHPILQRFVVAPPRTLSAGVNFHPAVTGVDSGWVVAWGTTGNTEMVAVRSVMPLSPLTDISLVTKAPWPSGGVTWLDSLAQYPTLAYRPMRRFIPPDAFPYQVAHLAYQQHGGVSWYILYNQVMVGFTSGARPVIALTPTEHVSQGLPGCQFIHPSISVDSVRIGVAFERLDLVSPQIVLRFRDTISRRGAWWLTPAYTWGTRAEDYERPSLTEFPLLDSAGLRFNPEGGLVWHWTNASDSVHNRVLLYRYGAFATEDMGPGAHPSMGLVPYKRVSPFAATSLLHRLDDAQKFSGRRIAGGTAWYYPAAIRNIPTNQVGSFVVPAPGKGIIAEGVLSLPRIPVLPCQSSSGSMRIGIVTHGPLPPIPPGPVPPPPFPPYFPPTIPGLPPTFFGSGFDGHTIVDSIDVVDRVTRTGVFDAGGGTVPIHRRFVIGDSLLAWLDQLPYDSTLNRPADILVMTELVRVSDSTVIWQADTVSVRSIATDTLDQFVTVPVGAVAAPGTKLFIRLRPVPTSGVNSESVGEFGFLENAPLPTLFAKPGSPEPVKSRHDPNPGSMLHPRILPNPTSGEAELVFSADQPCTVRITIYDALGKAVASPMEFDVPGAGSYSRQLDLDGVRDGIYLAVVETGNDRATVRFTVMKR